MKRLMLKEEVLPELFIEDRTQFERNNIITVLLVGALPAIAGSAISFILGICLAWAVISVMRGTYRLEYFGDDLKICVAFSAFALVMFAAAMVPSNRMEAFPHLVWLIPFFAPWFLIPRFRAGRDLDYLKFFIIGAGLGAILALVLAGIQLGLGVARPTGGAGNAAVFGMVSLLLAAIAGLHIDAPERNLRWLAFFGTIAGLLATIISMTRGVWISAAFASILLLFYAPRHWAATIREFWIPLAALAVASVVFLFQRFASRIDHTFWEINQFFTGGYSVSFVERYRLWEAAIATIAESPIIGHGIHNRMPALYSMISDDFPDRSVTHAHNAFLNFYIDAGIFGLISLLVLLFAPLYVAIVTPADRLYRRRLYFCLITVTIYVTCGFTQIMLNHDILDSFIILSAIIVAISIKPQSEAVPAAGQDQLTAGGRGEPT